MAVGIRWTIGDVSERGWEALRLSVYCAVHLFGSDAEYVICFNSVDRSCAMLRARSMPDAVQWREVSQEDIPAWLREHLTPAMAEGVGWKFAPLRLFPDRHELALDNDCILWNLPLAMDEWLRSTDRVLMAEDVERCLGQFQDCSAPGCINSGIRGLPPGFPLNAELQAALQAAEETARKVMLVSELDEQGLQAAALTRQGKLQLVRSDEVTICSPFWPRQPHPGSCGAHFVGINSRVIPWRYYGRPADEVRREHWDEYRADLYRRADLPLVYSEEEAEMAA